MNLSVFNAITLCIGMGFIAYTMRRATRAVRSDRVAGFILNPCFYLSGYAFLYILVGTLISGAGQELYGFSFSYETRSLSNTLMLYYFAVFFLVYVLSEDKAFVFNKTIPIISLAIVRIIGFGCFLIVLMIIVIHGENLLSLNSDRNQVYEYFVSHIFYDMRYGALINFMIMVFFCECLASKNKINPLRIAIFIFLPVLVLEVLLGGRAVLLKVILSIFIMTCLRNNKLYLRYIFYSFILLAAIGLIQRFDVATMELGEAILRGLGELIVTRTTTDLVVENGLSGDGFEYLISSLLSLLPGVINTMVFPDGVNYIDIVTSSSGREFGVGGNIVSEAYYYGGLSFALISPLFIASIMYFLNGANFTRRVPGFIFRIFVILGLQNIMRTSFYDQILVYVYLMFSYFLFITILESNNLVLRRCR